MKSTVTGKTLAKRAATSVLAIAAVSAIFAVKAIDGQMTDGAARAPGAPVLAALD